MEINELEQFVSSWLLNLMNVVYHSYLENKENFLLNLTNLVHHVSVLMIKKYHLFSSIMQ